MVDIGRLNQRVTFFAPKSVTNEKTHFTSKQMQEMRTVWASVEAKTGSQYKDVEADRNRISWDIYIRKIPGLEMSQDMELHWCNNRILKINGVLPTKDRAMLHLLCTEVIQ